MDHICKFLEDWAGRLEGSLDDAALVLGQKGVNSILHDPSILKGVGYFCADILTEDFLGLSLCSLLALRSAFSLGFALGQLFVRFGACGGSSGGVSLREFLKNVISQVLETISDGRNWVSYGFTNASHRLTSLLGNESEQSDVIAAEILEVVVQRGLLPIVLTVPQLLRLLDEGSENLSQVSVDLIEHSRALQRVVDLRPH